MVIGKYTPNINLDEYIKHRRQKIMEELGITERSIQGISEIEESVQDIPERKEYIIEDEINLSEDILDTWTLYG